MFAVKRMRLKRTTLPVESAASTLNQESEMARPRFDVQKDRKWRKAIADWQASGLSMTAFCRRENLKLGSFCDWRRAIQKRDAAKATRSATSVATTSARDDITSGVDFVPVVLTEPLARTAHKFALEITLRNGAIVSVQENCPTALLASVVQLLGVQHV